jgi:cell division protein FtsA
MAMENLEKIKDDLVFGLDIGTRNVVGVVGYMAKERFRVVAMANEEHETRAMLDGQIHDIYKVGDVIRKVKVKLEEELGMELKDVCIAAAGRILRTLNVSAEYKFDEEKRVTKEDVYSLDLLAVEKAHKEINSNGQIRFFCVGNTPIRYRLNGYDINNLEGHKADNIGVDLIATFLPEEVVDGLYEAVSYAGLSVANLTLEPIAAMDIAIPENYRLLNIALIDIGAGTSDICVTKDGYVMAYGMIPYAGDEITEAIAKGCLVDFNAAEKIKVQASKKKGAITYKDIMGLQHKVQPAEIFQYADEVMDRVAQETARKIKEINGDKPTSAVFLVGGGGKMAGYSDKLARELGIPAERVAVRGEEVLSSVDFNVAGFKKDSLYVTPVGICTSYYSQKNNFIFITVNGSRLKMYDNNHLTLVDAVMQVGFPNESLFPRRGEALEFTVNGKARLVRGQFGEGAVVKLNGKEANLNARIVKNDVIEVEKSTVGKAGEQSISQLPEYNSSLDFMVNDKKISCPRFAYVNGELKSPFYDIQQGDSIVMENYYTVSQLFEFLDYDITGKDVYVNHEMCDMDTKVYENFTVTTAAIEDRPNIHNAEEAMKAAAELKAAQDADNFENLPEDDGSYAAQKAEKDKVDREKAIKEKEEALANAQKAIELKHKLKDGTITPEELDALLGVDTSAQEAEPEEKKEVHDIHITVNDTPVTLSGKAEYVVVDLFDGYDFDLKNPQGNGNVVLQCNGVEKQYMAPLEDGAVIKLYWN